MTDPARFLAAWNFPTSIRFGAGRLAELGRACRELGMTRPLLVTDRGLRDGPIVAAALQALREERLAAATFADVQGNPTLRNVEDGLAAWRSGGHDGVVGLGGGSAIDTAKNVALMSGQSRPLLDFVDVGENWRRVDPAGVAPLVAVPTAAGTGSEVGRSAVVTDQRAQAKRVIFHPRMLPAIVLADPALARGLPPHLTAATGMDALSHALEALCCEGFHPMADGIAVEAVRLVAQWLPRAVADGADMPARAHMLAAAMMGAVAFQKGLGAMHAMSHPCSAVYDSHHGLTNAVLMPYVLRYNRPAVAEKATRLARVLGLRRPGFPALLDWVLRLRESIGIPHALTALAIPADAADRLAPLAEADPLTALNPRPVAARDYRRLYRDALEGRL